MTPVFVDTSHWIALLHERDQLHQRAIAWASALDGTPLVTTDEVLTELLSTFAGSRHRRVVASKSVRTLLAHANVEVVPQSRATFLSGLDLFERREDRAYSLVDCVSFVCMQARGIRRALTHDRHFEQEGYVALLRHAPNGA